MATIVGIGSLGLSLGLALSACSPATSSASAPTATTQPAATSPVATSAPAGTTAPATAGSTGASLVPMQTAEGGEFVSPSGNISCEVDYQKAGLTQVYCQTGSPARSVTMSADGTYKTCIGQQCLGNPGEGTPILAYGTATGVGPFRCESAATGVTCTANGTGFRISTSGITPASA